MKSNFDYLKSSWPHLYESARTAEENAHTAPRTSIFYARYALEQIVTWLFDNDTTLSPPFERTLAAMIHDANFKQQLLPAQLFEPVNLIRKIGNQAVHPGYRVRPENAILIVKHLHLFTAWFAKLYSSYAPLIPAFDVKLIPTEGVAEKSATELQKLQTELKQRDELAREQESQLERATAEIERYQRELQALKTKNRRAAVSQSEKLDHNEEETRNLFIDLMLREAGWDPHGENVREYEVTGMPTPSKTGYADYVLWGADGLPLAVVEVKSTKKSAEEGKRQAELYANCLEKMTGQRPLIFYTNGYETKFWDDTFYPARPVQGFLTQDELQLAVHRRTTRADLTKAPINETIVERYYQHAAIRSVGEALSAKHRKCLLGMATGSGKTRTAVALTEQLMKANWVRRVLFLADRRELVKQADNAFNDHYPSASRVNLLEKKEDDNSRIVISTYPTLLNAIDDRKTDGQSRFGPGYFDLIWLDEVHRSVYKKYQAIFDYFDSLVIGLTATPRDEISRNTYNFLELQEGIPTYAYELNQGVADEFLVPARGATVPLKFKREGIKYAELSDEEQEDYEEKFFDDETESMPEEIDSSALDSWLLNDNTVDQMLLHLMENGIKVAGGERLGKTVIFAKNQRHADHIQERFDLLYPQLTGKYMRVIHNRVKYVDTLIEEFSQKNKEPHIAVSVDMLDTGIDIPEIVNLVFFKPVKSRVKYWQMVGRGTRLCPDLFGPGLDKKHFIIFDFCSNFEFFDAHPKGIETTPTPSLSQQIFKCKLSLALALKKDILRDEPSHRRYAGQLLDELHTDVARLNPESAPVRPRQKYVRPYQKRDHWDGLDEVHSAELSEYVSGLISHPYRNELASRFDLMIHKLQLALLNNSPEREALREKLQTIAAGLELKANIPAVNHSLELIKQIQSDDYWTNISAPALENVREQLRELMELVDKKEGREPLYTNFTDEMGEVQYRDDIIQSEPGYGSYRRKVEKLLDGLLDDDTVIWKLKQNQPLTTRDIEHLEELLFSEKGGIGSREDYKREVGEISPGIFIRSIIGLDRGAAKAAFNDFLSGSTLSADQIAFVDRIINYISENGVIEPQILYEAPFTDIHSHGIDGLFETEQVQSLLGIMEQIRQNAAA